MIHRMELQVDFYQQDEASLFLESNAPGDLHDFGEIVLFDCFTLRQMHNLVRAPASMVLASLLGSIHGVVDVLELVTTTPQDFPRLVDYRGIPGRKRFLATLDFNTERASFILKPRGFGLLGKGVNYYAPHSVILLLKYLASRHISDSEYLARISRAANICAMVFVQRKVTTFTQAGLAVGIARTVFGYPV